MSKLRCTCGHIIIDQSDNLPYKGYILPDTALEGVSAIFTDAIDTLIQAVNTRDRLTWIQQNFQAGYPTDLSESAMIQDLLSGKLAAATRYIFECAQCGRIAIQVGQTDQFRFFSAESDPSAKALGGKN